MALNLWEKHRDEKGDRIIGGDIIMTESMKIDLLIQIFCV